MAEKTKKTERKNLRAMPSNVEAEQNVLGALLIDDKMAIPIKYSSHLI